MSLSSTCHVSRVTQLCRASTGGGGGRGCEGGAEEARPCGGQPPCPLAEARPGLLCLWSSWAPWTPCSASCQGGRQTRVRVLLVGGGGRRGRALDQDQCGGGGAAQETRGCGQGACPGAGQEQELSTATISLGSPRAAQAGDPVRNTTESADNSVDDSDSEAPLITRDKPLQGGDPSDPYRTDDDTSVTRDDPVTDDQNSLLHTSTLPTLDTSTGPRLQCFSCGSLFSAASAPAQHSTPRSPSSARSAGRARPVCCTPGGCHTTTQVADKLGLECLGSRLLDWKNILSREF